MSSPRGWVGWVAPLALVGSLAGCLALNPARRYELAAKQLRFSLDRVEVNLEPALPLSRSRVRLRLTVGVVNPTDQPLRAERIEGQLRMVALGRTYPLGELAFPAGADIKAQERSRVQAELLLGVGDLQTAWEPLVQAARHQAPATWRLEGKVWFRVLGIELEVPYHVARESGS